MAETAEHLRAAVGVLVARLSLRERVADVLREAFVLPYLDIGRLLGLTEANARQIVRRARLRVAHDLPVPDRPLTEQMQLVAADADAVAAGEHALLRARPKTDSSRKLDLS
jgi:hypothetical protein